MPQPNRGLRVVWHVLTQDVHANVRVDAPGSLIRTLLTARMMATILFRLSQLVGQRLQWAGGLVKQVNQLVTGADVAWQAQVGPGLVLFHPVGVVIGPHVRLGDDCSLQQGVTVGGSGRRAGQDPSSPVVGDRVEFGAGARCFGPIVVGQDVIIGANAVVVKSVPDRAVVAGVPARIVRYQGMDSGTLPSS